MSVFRQRRGPWTGMRLDAEFDWDEVATIVQRSYRLTAPKKLAVQLGEIESVPPQRRTIRSR
jgi:hypothetical protein